MLRLQIFCFVLTLVVLREALSISNRQAKRSVYEIAQGAIGSPLRGVSGIDTSKLLSGDSWVLLSQGVNPLESAKVRTKTRAICCIHNYLNNS